MALLELPPEFRADTMPEPHFILLNNNFILKNQAWNISPLIQSLLHSLKKKKCLFLGKQIIFFFLI